MNTQEVVGILLLPLSYLVITLIIAIRKGKYWDKQFGLIRAGRNSQVPARIKTWKMGAIGVIIICLVAPIGELAYNFVEHTVSVLPVFIQPIACALIFLMGAGGACILMCLPHLCMAACCDISYEI